MNKPKLSDRAQFLLWLVAQRTDKNWSTGELKSLFVPPRQTGYSIYYYDNGTQCSCDIRGSGDANAFKGLERKGFIERPKTTLPNDYVYIVTEAGLLVIEQLGLNERFR